MRAQRLHANVRQHKRPETLLGFQCLQHETLIDDLELLADADLPALKIDVVPSKSGRFPEPKAAR
jgi:hypothetical protein